MRQFVWVTKQKESICSTTTSYHFFSSLRNIWCFLLLFLLWKSLRQNVVYMCMCHCVCVHACVLCMCVCVCLGMVTASDMRMHHVLIILTMTVIQGHTDLNHENNNWLFQKLYEDSTTKGLYNLFWFRWTCLSFDSGSQLHLKLDTFLTCTIIIIAIS